MIPATAPYVATVDGFQIPVVAWSDEGEALVVDSRRGTLRPARTLTGFTAVTEDDESIVTAVPGGGWMMRYIAEDGSTWVEPVVAWAVDRRGYADALATDSTGAVEPLRGLTRRPEFFHPNRRDEPGPVAGGGDTP